VTSGYKAQWLERLTADQQVPVSNPGVPCCQLIIATTIIVVIVRFVIVIISIVSIHHPSSTLVVVLRHQSFYCSCICGYQGAHIPFSFKPLRRARGGLPLRFHSLPRHRRRARARSRLGPLFYLMFHGGRKVKLTLCKQGQKVTLRYPVRLAVIARSNLEAASLSWESVRLKI
jgi:hypothetical protein